MHSGPDVFAGHAGLRHSNELFKRESFGLGIVHEFLDSIVGDETLPFFQFLKNQILKAFVTGPWWH
jgi:hypothetical protein